MADGGMGRHCNLDGAPWTAAEDALIRSRWETTSDAELAGALPGRTAPAVRGRRQALELQRAPASKRWTAREVAVLQGIEGYSYDYLMRRLPGRTRLAIVAKLKLLGINFRQGVYSVAEVAERTGYDVKQLRRARRAIGQRWTFARDGRAARYNQRGRHAMITEEQVDELVAWLGRPLTIVTRKGALSDRWSLEWECCRRCGTKGSKRVEQHIADGYCDRCYRKVRLLPKCSDCGALIWTLFRLNSKAKQRRWYEAKKADPAAWAELLEGINRRRRARLAKAAP